jgi:hypothetical protein
MTRLLTGLLVAASWTAISTSAFSAGVDPPAAAPDPAAPAPAAPAADQVDDNVTTLWSKAGTPSVFNFDYGPPASPGLTLLGLSPDTTTPSTTLTKFALALPAVFGSSGGQAAAFDFAPASIWEKLSDTSYTNYIDAADPQRGYFNRLGQRARIELAVKGGTLDSGNASNNVASGIAIGASVSLLDSSDPIATRMSGGTSYLGRCLNAFTPAVTLALSPNADAAGAATLLEQRISQIGHVQAEARAQHIVSARAGARAFLMAGPSLKSPDVNAAAINTMSLAKLQAFADAERQALESKLSAVNAAGDQQVSTDLAAQVKAHFGGRTVAGAFAACSTQASRIAQFSPDLKIGLGTVWNGAPGALRNLTSGSEVGWVAFKFPVPGTVSLPDANDPNEQNQTAPTSALMFALSGRFGHDEEVQTGKAATPQIMADTINAWAGLEWIEPTWRVAGQYGWSKTSATDRAEDAFNQSGARYLVSTQLRLGGTGVWLGASYGNAYGTAAALKSSTALVTLSYTPPPPPDITAAK